MTEQNPKTNQGEGDIKSAKRFNEKQKGFVDSDTGKKVISNIAELEGDAKRKAEKAEKAARDKAAEKDPQVTRDYKRAQE